MSARLAVIPQDVEKRRVFKGSYCLEVQLSIAQRRALIETSLDRGVPAGRVLARRLSEPDSRGRNIEIISGWHFLEAYWEENDRSVWVNVSEIEAGDADAVFYGIQNAFEEAKTEGFQVSVIEYAEAVQRARQHFQNSIPSMTQMAAALRIGRPTLVNRVQLLDKLAYYTLNLVREGKVSESTAKILATVKNERDQVRFAETLINNPMSRDAFYALVNPEFKPQRQTSSKSVEVPKPKTADELSLLRQIEARYGTRADIAPDQEGGRGTVVRLRFHSAAELRGLADRLMQKPDPSGAVTGELVLKSGSNDELDSLLTVMGVFEDDF